MPERARVEQPASGKAKWELRGMFSIYIDIVKLVEQQVNRRDER